MAGQRYTRNSRDRRDGVPRGHHYPGDLPDLTRADRPSSRADAARRFAAQWSGRLSAVLPSARRAGSRVPPGGYASQSRSRAPRRRRLLLRWGLVALLVLIVLAAVGGALYRLSHAAQDAASQLCADAVAGRYGAAYDLLGAALQAQVSRKDFDRIGTALDTLDGRVTSCTATSYDYALGSGQAAITAHIVRADGQTFSGRVEMRDQNGWKAATLDPRLTGASLGALDVALRFCDALRADDGGALLALSSENASAGLGSAQQLAATLKTWQQVDGAVTGCTLAGTSAAQASATTAQVTLSVTRARRGTTVEALSLAGGPRGWHATTIGANLLGSDLGPLAVGQRFCAALAAGSYAGAYALFSPTYTAQVSLGQFTAAFAPLGGSWSCAPRLDTYAVSGSTGSYDVSLTLTGAGQPLALTATLRFTLTGSTWAIQAVEPHG